MQTLVIWSASGRTVGVTLSSILTCSRTSSGILFNNAELMVLSCNQTKTTNQSWAQNLQQKCTSVQLAWSNCLLKLLKMSCLLTWKTGFPSLKTACMTTPREYMSEAESQLTDRMYSGARYSGLGRQRGGRLGSHSLHVYLGWGAREDSGIHTWQHSWKLIWSSKTASPSHLSIWRVCGRDAEVKAHNLPGATLVEDNVFWTQVPVDHFHTTVEERQALRDLKMKQNRAFSKIFKHGTSVNVLLKTDNRDRWWGLTA